MGHHHVAVIAHEHVAGLDVSHLQAAVVKLPPDFGECEEEVPKFALVELFEFIHFAVEDFAEKHEGETIVFDLRADSGTFAMPPDPHAPLGVKLCLRGLKLT